MRSQQNIKMFMFLYSNSFANDIKTEPITVRFGGITRKKNSAQVVNHLSLSVVYPRS